MTVRSILVRSLGGDPTQALVKAIVAQENFTTPFDFPHFLDLMAKHMKPELFKRQLRDAFKVLDKESTDYLPVSKPRHILTSVGEKLEPVELDQWIREVGMGSDAKIRPKLKSGTNVRRRRSGHSLISRWPLASGNNEGLHRLLAFPNRED